jgi:hypothetical protein
MKREKLLAFSKLLNRVKFQNNWNSATFESCSEKTENVTKSEAFRFYKALVELGYLVKSGRTYKPAFDSKIWHDEDYRLNIIKNILEDQLIIQKRGRVKGKIYDIPKEAAVVVTKHNPLESISSKDLVMELRSRGFEVTCKRSVTVVEEL